MNDGAEAEPLFELAQAIADGGALDFDAMAARLPAAQLAVARRIVAMRDLTGHHAGDGGDPLVTGFDVIHELGRGAHGVVHLARDRALGREVALKTVRDDGFVTPAARARFLGEARALARLTHPNIVKIHSIDEQDGLLRLSLERVDGTPLDQCVRNGGPLPADEVARIGAALASALVAIHAAGIVHGDLKPSNVLLGRDGRVVLLDFGIARVAGDAGEETWSTGLQGTPLFMAPEVIDGDLPDGRADLFALGALLFYLATGTYPFVGEDLATIRTRVRDRAAIDRALLSIPQALGRTIGRCLQERREQRPATADEVLLALRHHLDRHRRTRRQLTLGAIGFLLAAVAVLGTTWQPTRGVVTADLLRLAGGVEERLQPGDAVAAGDRLVLDLTLDQPMYLYVFNEDDHGAIAGLFPLADVAPTNPVRRGDRIRLPGRRGDDPQEWIMGDSGSAEFFLLIASPDRLTEAEDLVGAGALVGPATAGIDAGPVRSVDTLRAAPSAPRQSVPDFASTRLADFARRMSTHADTTVHWFGLRHR